MRSKYHPIIYMDRSLTISQWAVLASDQCTLVSANSITSRSNPLGVWVGLSDTFRMGEGKRRKRGDSPTSGSYFHESPTQQHCQDLQVQVNVNGTRIAVWKKLWKNAGTEALANGSAVSGEGYRAARRLLLSQGTLVPTAPCNTPAAQRILKSVSLPRIFFLKWSQTRPISM